MPARIERIERTKSRLPQYIVFLDAGEEFKIHEDTLLRFRLSSGVVIDEELISEIRDFEQEVRCREQAYRFLARRPHLERELTLKLRRKGYELSLIEKIIMYLKDKKLLDDADFIRRFAEEEKKLRHSGPLRIRKKLLEKGAPRDLLESWLETHYSEEEQMRQAGLLAQKKYNMLQNDQPDKRLQKIIRFLQQKGFPWQVIREVIAQWEEDNG